MVARLVAGIVVLVGLAAIAVVVGLGGESDAESVETASPAAPSNATSTAVPTGVTAAPTAVTSSTEAPTEVPDNYGQRKDLINLDGWLNTNAESIDEFNGKVLVVEMWTFGCFNCKARIPHTQALYAAHSREDFEIIGVHAPEFDHEAEIPNIVDAVERLGVTWPVALDTEKTNFRGWQDGGRRFWPRTYVIDQNGDVRYDHIGEGRYQELADTVQFLVDNPPTT